MLAVNVMPVVGNVEPQYAAAAKYSQQHSENIFIGIHLFLAGKRHLCHKQM